VWSLPSLPVADITQTVAGIASWQQKAATALMQKPTRSFETKAHNYLTQSQMTSQSDRPAIRVRSQQQSGIKMVLMIRSAAVSTKLRQQSKSATQAAFAITRAEASL